ncbi:hypothetical protein [Streptomyces chartreusis]|uniref:hypothetical protein n=1 Tax=Streptomyces chartreusis TaxID=1969 RepID=UPI002E173DFC
MTTTLTDAAGRTVQAGDTVGGTTSGRYQTTITGPVLQIGKGKAKVLVTNRPTYTGDRPGNADDVWISADRLFLVHPAAERRFVGFRTQDGHTWTQAARVKGVLWEAPMVPKRYEATDLRGMYSADLQPVWEDVHAAPAPAVVESPAAIRAAAINEVIAEFRREPLGVLPRLEKLAAEAPAAQSPAEIRAQAFLEGAARIFDLPQDYELDPGRGDARELLERLAAETHQPDAYPLTVPWALLMDNDDLIGFLNELAGVMQDAPHMATQAGHVHARNILDGLEKTCGTWRLIAEAQHAHNTAPGPDAEATA